MHNEYPHKILIDAMWTLHYYYCVLHCMVLYCVVVPNFIMQCGTLPLCQKVTWTMHNEYSDKIRIAGMCTTIAVYCTRICCAVL